MFCDFFENFRHPGRAVEQALCVAALVMLSLTPGLSGRGNPDLAHSASQSITMAPRGAAAGAPSAAPQRTVWLVRFDSFELRIERNSSRGSRSWSVTLLTNSSEERKDAAREDCI